MGDYNPHVPYILGEEWVGIRDEVLTFEPTVNTVEQGHRFTLATASQVNHGRVYIDEVPPNGSNGSVIAVSIYPAGLSDNSGPIRTVDIPVLSVTITGDSPTAITTVSVNGASTAVGALYSQGTDSYIRFAGSLSDFRWVNILFDIQRYAGLLQNKRILNMQLLYTADCTDTLIEQDPTQSFGAANSIFNTFIFWTPNPGIFLNNTPFLGRMLARPDEGAITDLGELNMHFSGQVPIANYNQVPDRMNWSWAELSRVSGSASPFIYTMMGMGGSNTVNESVFLYYVGLRITYCEEQRVAYGARGIGLSFSNAYGQTAVPGAFIIPLRSPTTMAANPVLAAGAYDVVVSSATQATPLTPTAGFPPLNALRQLYEIPSHPAVKTRIPFPLDTSLGLEFESQDTVILPQLSLHTTGGTLTQPHVYGRQAAAQVYGSQTAVQDIYDLPVGSAQPFPQVRYYARRFGDTTTSLTLTGLSPAAGLSLPGTAGSYASTPDNAALDITGDIDIRADVTLTDWVTSGGISQMFVAKYNTTGNQRSYRFEVFDGTLSLTWSTAGTSGTVLFDSSASIASLVADNRRLAIRATLDVNNGAAGHTTTFYTAPTIAGPWTQLGSPVVTAGVTSIFSGTAILEVGTSSAGTNDPLQGVVHAVEVYNGIAGTAVANPDFSAQAAGTTSFADAAGRTWTLNGTASIIAGVTGSTVAVTPSAFDALDEIVDGWKDVTLRFASPPLMGTSTVLPSWMWSAVGETVGNRWEVLGVSSYAITGLPSNGLTLVASPNQTSVATYGAAVSGSIVNLDWMPGLAPTVTGTTEDPSADAVLIFSQDPHTITGVTITPSSQAVTGFIECERGPCCIPTAIAYNRVTWSMSTLPITGFGAYELQRYDSVGTEWETIMLATSVTITGFNDYEARVGLTSSYQIRQTNVLDFAGAWSVTGTGAVAEPGVTMPSCGTNKRGVLIFTSNEVQDGSRNLAYAMTWNDEVVEDFDFPEAGTIDIQRHHDRDFQVAFHGSERGGEQFSRRLLLANAAIPLPRLGNTHSLRDLAWDDLSYVCVRDDIGDRWLSTVIVPHTEVRRRRRLYNADITVIEVTDTPSPVDP